MSARRRQLLSLCAVALLSPALRLYPSLSASLAGKAAFLSALLALAPLLLYARMLSALDCDLPGLSHRALGKGPGRLALLPVLLWLLLETGFVLRAGAERMVVALFPSCGTGPFIWSMGLVCLLAALGSLDSILRVGRMILPLMLGFLLLILLACLKDLDKSLLLPLGAGDLPAAALGALPVADVLGLGLYLPLLLEKPADQQGRFRSSALWLLGMVLLLTGLCVGVLGSFGAELSTRLSLPFFTLVRNLIFFQSLERLEALIVSLWIFPDFLLGSALLHAARRCLAFLLEDESLLRPAPRYDLRGRRWLIFLCGVASVLLALIMAPDPERLEFFSHKLLPLCNLILAFAWIPLLYIIDRLRRRKAKK